MHSKIPSTAASLQSAAPLLTSLLPTSPSHSLPSTHTDTHTQHTHHSLTEDTSVISADNSYTIKTTLPAIPTCSQLQQSISPPHTNTVTHSTPKPSTPSSYLGHTLDSSSAHPHTPTAAESRDVSWLLQNLRPHTPRDQRHEAALLLQHWAKHADAAFWISNNAQVVQIVGQYLLFPDINNFSCKYDGRLSVPCWKPSSLHLREITLLLLLHRLPRHPRQFSFHHQLACHWLSIRDAEPRL